jgi:hypothetical protein
MNLKEITQLLCQQEGLKVEVSYGNMREILGLVAKLLYQDNLNEHKEMIYTQLLKLGKNKSKKK